MKKAITTHQAPAAIGPYSQGISAGNIVFLSGQLGIDPSTGNFVSEDVKEQTRQVFRNIEAILQQAGLSFHEVVKTTVFLADMNDFAAMNEIYAGYFKEPYPARSTVAVKTLPRNGLVEIEVIAVNNR